MPEMYNDMYEHNQRRKASNKVIKKHQSRIKQPTSKQVLLYDRAEADKFRQSIKNFKRQQAIRRLMHCHPEQPSENDHGIVYEEDWAYYDDPNYSDAW